MTEPITEYLGTELSTQQPIDYEAWFQLNVNFYKGIGWDYYYTGDDITFLIPMSRHLSYWLYRYIAPIILLVGVCGNLLSAVVLMSKRMR